MKCRNRRGKVNVKLLVILIAVTAGLGVSLVVARQVHRSALSEAAMAAGEKAFENKDWPAAAKSYRAYLGRNPDDLAILGKYAQACLAIRPLDTQALSGAVAAYRRIIELDPQNGAAYEKLAMLYGALGNYDEISVVARARLEHDPNDCRAPLWLADALIRQNKNQQAEEVLVPFIDRIGAFPDRRVEYVRACAKMGEVALGGGSTDAKTKALDWLNRAVDHAPQSAEALLSRARFYRAINEIPGVEEIDRLSLAREDLEEADRGGADNPQVCLFLAAEWLAHGQYDRTLAALQAGDRFTPQTLQEQFFDTGDWITARFLLEAEVATRRGTAAEAVALADQALASLIEKRHRAQVLPSAVLIYVAAGKVPEARWCLDEYLGLVRTHEGSGSPTRNPALGNPSAQSARRLAGLQALVAGVENRPHAVIDALASVVGGEASNPELWRMLAEAYSRTDQTGRAINALNQYYRLNPQDARTLVELARQYSRLGDWKNAMEAAGRAESQGVSGLAPKVLRIGAALNLAVGQRDAVNMAELKKLSAELADLRQANPDQVDIRMLQAMIADQQGQPEEVEQQLKLAIAECTDPLRARIQLAGHYLRAKRVSEAVTVCETACRDHPETIEPWLSLADVHVANTDYDAARKCLRQGLTTVTNDRVKRGLSIKLALLEAIHGNQAAGTNLLREMAAQDPQEIQARLLLLGIRSIREDRAAVERLIAELRQAEGEGGLWWRVHQASLRLSSEDWRKRQKEIQDLLQFCIDANPAWSAPVLLLSQMYEQLGDTKRVEDTCRQALAANPLAAEIAGRLLALLEKQGRFADAQRVLGQVQISPQVVSAWQIRIAVGAGDFSRAIDELKLRAAGDDKDANSRIHLARLIYQQTKDTNEAFKYLQEAQTIASDIPTLIAVRASILKAEGRTAEALQALDDYVIDRKDFTAYWMRAVYLAEAGELERAERDYRKLTTFAQNSETGYELLGKFYGGTQKPDQGIAAVEEGLHAYPGSLGLKRGLMVLLFARAQTGDREKAFEILAELERRLPQDAELLTMRAAQMLETATPESLASARMKLENAVRLEPTAVNAHYALINTALREGQYKTACDYAVRALESNPGHPVLLLARARAELLLGYAPMAVRLTREVLKRDPNNVEALNVLADGAINGGDRVLLQEARTLIDAALGRNPKSQTLLISRAHVLSALDLSKEAIPALEAYGRTEEGRSSAAVLVTMADLYRLTGDADKSKQMIERAQQIDPNNQTVIHARLLWLLSQNRVAEIQGISSTYIRAPEQNPAMLLNAASLLAASDSMELKTEGLRLFEHAAALSPASVETRLGLASALYQTGDVGQAEKTYRDLLEQHSDNVRALNDLAWILQEHDRRYDAALKLANRGMKLAPDNLNLLDTRGTILMNMPDRLADARRDFEEIVRLSSSDPRRQARAFLQLGRICLRLSDFSQAKRNLLTAMEIDRRAGVFTEDERSEITKMFERSGE